MTLLQLTYVCTTSKIGKVARFTTVITTTSRIGTFLLHTKLTAFLSGIPVGAIAGSLEELQPEKTLELFRISTTIPLTSFSRAKFRPVRITKKMLTI